MRACDENGCQCAVYRTLNIVQALKHPRLRLFKQKVLHTHSMQVEKAHSKVEWRAYNVIRNAIEIQLFTMSTEQIMGATKKNWKKIIICFELERMSHWSASVKIMNFVFGCLPFTVHTNHDS